MPLSCPVAPSSQRELRKGGGGGGGCVARRARTARAPKAKSCATSCGTFFATSWGTSFATSSAASCAASFTCSSFTCRPREALGRYACVSRGFRRWKMTRATMNTFKLPSFAAFTCSSFTSHLRASAGGSTRSLGVGVVVVVVVVVVESLLLEQRFSGREGRGSNVSSSSRTVGRTCTHPGVDE